MNKMLIFSETIITKTSKFKIINFKILLYTSLHFFTMTSRAFTETIDTIPEEFLGCESLVFDCVDKLPDNLSECKNLKYLNIVCSNIDTLNIANLQLEFLYFLECSNLKNFIDEIKTISTLVSFSSDSCELGHIPDFSMLKNLKQLTLKSEEITEIPDYVSSFTTTLINLESNMVATIENIPSCIEFLILNDNDIQSCNNVKNFKYLNVFDITYNKIHHIPAFNGCDELMVINASDNNVISSDDDIFNRKKLVYVDCDDGVLDELKPTEEFFKNLPANENVLKYFNESY